MNRESGFTRGSLFAVIGEFSFVLFSGMVGFGLFSLSDVGERFADLSVRYERFRLAETFGALLFGAGAMACLIVVRWIRERGQVRHLVESEMRFGRLFEGTSDAIVISDECGRIVEVNERAAQSLGYGRDELLGRSVFDIEVGFAPDDHPETMDRLLAGERIFAQGINRRKDGTTFPVESSAVLAEDKVSGERVFLTSVRDVSEREDAERRLRDSRDTTDAIFAVIPDPVCRIDSNGNYLSVTKGADRPLFKRREEIIGHNVREVLGAETGGRFMAKVRLAFETGEVQRLLYPFHLPYGETRHIESRIVTVGGMEAIYIARDVTEIRETILRLNRSEQRNRAIVESVPDLIFRFDADGRCLDLHAGDERRLMLPKERTIGSRMSEVLPDGIGELFERNIKKTLASGKMHVFEYDVRNRDDFRHREARMVANGTEEVVCFVRDVGERIEYEARIKKIAYTDELTGLPNRTAFMENLNRAIEDPERRPGVMLLANLKDFARINSTLGRESGDRLIRMFGEQSLKYLKDIGEEKAYICRFAGNEFATLLEGADEERVMEIINGAVGSYRDLPFQIDGMDVFLKPNIGVAKVEDGLSAEDVVRRATIALREVKAKPDCFYCVYEESMESRFLSDLSLERDLRRAIKNGDLHVCYQPEVYLESGKLYSLESLARWNHPERGMVSPAEFVPLAEETGLILPLGRYILKEACRQMGRWVAEMPDLAPCTVSVNVSALQLRQTGFVEMVRETLAENDLEPRRLQLEITESAAIEDFEASVRIFSELRSLGVRVALDDFGTGHSSLAHLRNFPLDALKLDRTFTADIATDRRTAQVVSSIVNIAHALDLHVVAEGIENAGQLEALGLLACDIGQGFHLSRPIPESETRALLETWTHTVPIPKAV